ncbi:YeeE/YedE thiosulfate transporter family protein [Psychromarinibacter sp. C21-152]|uniref:YeeE/YedE thiosulfate transporter family protein n=1 Tax=Psychromarinibacter sediminicola TaxID=3033385 RepID=A0AAE3NP87_9RHOB|nr:YeeE/YedE thiosulfate transporter family protein [Psychromarinibacter sediminicola]MDF0599591.1 YeeE/YedE thiosulfate transporter family protein [Psychromarinibacter sediminicola]
MEQDWIHGFLGGLMIGGAAALFLLVNGRIMGASGIVGGLVDGSGKSNWRERAAFVAGLVAVPPMLVPLYAEVDTHISQNVFVIVAAGLLVGIGSRLANGCTSGHGVCGISRFSLRGIVATVFYLLAGGMSVLLFKHLLGVI